jgi:hypothetical protein
MSKTLQSLFTAGALALGIGVFVAEMVAPQLPPYVGPADAATVRIVDVPCAAQLVMDTRDGAVRITPSESAAGGTCRIRADIRLYRTGVNAASDLDALLARVVEIDSNESALHVTSMPADWPSDVAAVIKYEVDVPRRANVQLRGVNGNVWVAEGCGEVRVEGVNADVSIYEPEGIVLARSTNGRLRLFGSRQPATLETVNGNIHAELLDGQLTATSINGEVRADLMRSTVNAAVLRSENGDVEVGLPRGGGFTLDAVADRGRVVGDAVIDGLKTGSGAYRGVAGSGELLLTLHSANGSIKLSRN